MNNQTRFALAIAAVSAGIGVGTAMIGTHTVSAQPGQQAPASQVPVGRPVKKIVLSEAQWRKKLTPEQYSVLREEGTERAFTGIYANHHEKGTYVCAGCDLPLFSSSTKFESGTGWPSYYQALSRSAVVEKTDNTYGMQRTEVECARCGGHLGHVFNDGPRPTGLRYCMNSVSLKFVPAGKQK
jgi:peptide-methionine (R)-S-oxide reductase